MWFNNATNKPKVVSKLLGTIIVILGAGFYFIPPLFSSGKAFDKTATIINECGEEVVVHGIYFDNVWMTLIYLLLSVMFVSIPFMRDVNRFVGYISFLLSGLFIISFTFEVINLANPLVVINSEGTDLTLYVTGFILSVILALFKHYSDKITEE